MNPRTQLGAGFYVHSCRAGALPPPNRLDDLPGDRRSTGLNFVILSEQSESKDLRTFRYICTKIGAKILRLRASPSAQDDILLLF